MAAHLDEQQELDNFKYLWKKGGRWLFAAAVAAGLAYLGYSWYQSHQSDKNKEAAAVLAQMVEKAQSSKDPKALNADLQSLQENYPKSIAATQATFMAAAAEFDKGNYPAATAHLEWVLKNQQDEFAKALATQRLAIVQLQEKQFDKALATLNTPTDASFEPLMLETKGDVYAAQGKNKEAAAAYEQSLNKLSKESGRREWLQARIQQLK